MHDDVICSREANLAFVWSVVMLEPASELSIFFLSAGIGSLLGLFS